MSSLVTSTPIHLINLVVATLELASRQLQRLAPLADLAMRLWVANVFWNAGVLKYQSWETTLLLFEYEYQVPLLAPHHAALAGTASELAFSAMLALGLGGRFAALGLSAVNVMAVLSYPGLNEIAREHHLVWGLMLLVPLFHGPGKLSLDHLLRRRITN